MEEGQTIAGKYRLNRLIGSGGMASVWSATNLFTERHFAIKVMLPTIARTEESKRRFLLEAKVSARINHANIIEVIDVGQAEDGSLFLVMELLTGCSLEAALHRRTPTMTLHELVTVMVAVARALAAAHASGVVHRDLKPTNVFLHQDRGGGVIPKVLDFGVSKVLEDESLHGLTVAGTVLGSPLYMSPEQASGTAGIDGRTDIFAFGAILFEALSGQRCYEAANFNALIVAIATTPPRSIDACAPDMPEPLRALVRECIVTDRKKRIGSFEQVAERLESMLPDLAASQQRLPPSTLTPLDVVSGGAAGPSSRRGGTYPPLATTGSLQSTPVSGSRTTAPALHLHAHAQASRSMWLMGTAGFAATAAVLGAVAMWSGRRGPIEPVVHAAARAPDPVPEHGRVAEARSVDVDTLPVVGTAGEAAATFGKLSVVAGPGSCEVVIDGVGRGATPLPVLDVAAGTHDVECRPPGRKPRAARVSVPGGGTARYKFALEP